MIKPSKTQSGGFLGTLLANIGIPMLIKVFTSKGALQMGRSTRSLPNRSTTKSKQAQAQAQAQAQSQALALKIRVRLEH